MSHEALFQRRRMEDYAGFHFRQKALNLMASICSPPDLFSGV